MTMHWPPTKSQWDPNAFVLGYIGSATFHHTKGPWIHDQKSLGNRAIVGIVGAGKPWRIHRQTAPRTGIGIVQVPPPLALQEIVHGAVHHSALRDATNAVSSASSSRPPECNDSPWQVQPPHLASLNSLILTKLTSTRTRTYLSSTM
jgi:hypothetical protein